MRLGDCTCALQASTCSSAVWQGLSRLVLLWHRAYALIGQWARGIKSKTPGHRMAHPEWGKLANLQSCGKRDVGFVFTKKKDRPTLVLFAEPLPCTYLLDRGWSLTKQKLQVANSWLIMMFPLLPLGIQKSALCPCIAWPCIACSELDCPCVAIARGCCHIF